MNHILKFRFLKYILPSLAFFVLLLLFIFPEFNQMTEDTKLKIPHVNFKNPVLFEIQGARFFAYDVQGRPLSIEIKKAVEKNISDQVISFESAEGEIRLDDSTWAVFQAEKGTLDLEKKIISLLDSVSIMSSTGYYIDALSLEISLKPFLIKSDSPVVAHGDFGTIQAAGFNYVPSQNLLFNGPLKSTLSKGF